MDIQRVYMKNKDEDQKTLKKKLIFTHSCVVYEKFLDNYHTEKKDDYTV